MALPPQAGQAGARKVKLSLGLLFYSEDFGYDHQSMQQMLTEGCVDWQGFSRQIAHEANALLVGTEAVLIFDESGFAR
jgi:hypothetical protein